MKFIDLLPKKQSSSIYRKNSRSIYTNPKIITQSPLRRNENQPPKKINRKQAIGGIVLIFFISLVILGSNYFKIKNIQINGDPKPETVEMIKTLEGKNIILFNTRKISKTLLEKQPAIKSIKVIVGYPDTVRINLIERDGVLIWESGGKKYLIDKEGVVFKETQKDDLIRVMDEKNVPVVLGQRILSTDLVDIIKIMSVKIPAIVSLPIKNFSISDSLFCITAHTEKFRMVFYTQIPIADQLTVLQKLYTSHKDEIKEYIDLRVDGYAYYK
ncbi:MAG: Uncharacterized protein CEN91_129 [Candidatus Berkelbacteria bacterium Licking1014_85]|uniref:POTRA domain-containing protein n=1 Tax=Candidatus Berkelbacteria bacterium Licking1014_85 TaxID=2017148 RepID=A0A554LLK5_9BACT|nr:MAG: Uncharacterized protein CEN91_129 [Candidatus Berkelbacteria bacterium Licking1014_85]